MSHEQPDARFKAVVFLLTMGGLAGVISPLALAGVEFSARIGISLATGVTLFALIPFLHRTRRIDLVIRIGAIISLGCFFSGFVFTGELYYVALGICTPVAVSIFASSKESFLFLVIFVALLFGCVFVIEQGLWEPPITPAAYTTGLFYESVVLALMAVTIACSAIWKERLAVLTMRREAAAEARARHQQQRFEVIYRSVYDAIVQIDDRGRIEWANGKLIQTLGFAPDSVYGRRLLSFASKSERKRLLRTLGGSDGESTKEFSVDVKVDVSEDRAHWVRVSGGAFIDAAGKRKWVAAVQDIHDDMIHLGRMQERSRLESLGTVCSGLAHDFNNLLTVIGIYGELVSDADLRREIMAAQRQAADVTAGLLTFARKQECRDQLVCVEQFLLIAQEMIERMLPATVNCTWHVDSGDAAVLIDPSQLQQVLINLVNNANHAMSSQGALQIVSCVRSVPSEQASVHGIQPGDYVSLEVADTGRGMSPETAMRAIEPFYTTKPRGKGTGLGLATVHGVATRAGGTLLISTKVDVGTRIAVLLPLQSHAIAESLCSSDYDSASSMIPNGGSDQILLVDDRDSVTDAISHVLEEFGYCVTTCSSAEEAWNRIAEQETFDVVITDIVLPGMSGIELVQQIRLAEPRTNAILISGHQHDELHILRQSPEITRYLPKPFRSEELLKTVGELLSNSRPLSI